MSRSIHSTRRDLDNARRAVYSDPTRQRAEVRRLRDALEQKRTIKECVLDERRSLGALAGLNLGRAYALSGNKDKAHPAYQDFLTLWKDADPDIPIYKEAKAEYAKLQ